MDDRLERAREPADIAMTATRRPGRLPSFKVLPEPPLAFSGIDTAATDVHPLRGLVNHGPYSGASLARYTEAIRIAIVGPPSGRDGRRSVLRAIQQSQEPKDRPDYVPAYPGFESVFGVGIVPAAPAAQISWPDVLPASPTGEPRDAVRAAIGSALDQLTQVRDLFDVAIIHLPESWLGLRSEGFDAHDEVKALGAQLAIPTQVINDRTFGVKLLASMSWRLAIALYVKAGGVPWRLGPLPGVPVHSAYIGLAYALRGDPRDARFVTCCSQVFDADGGGMQFVAYDARDEMDDTDEARDNPYLSRPDMRAVLARSLSLYQRRNGGAIPRRVVLHKTTRFTDDELAGAMDALSAVDEVEAVEVTTKVQWRGVWLRQPRSGQKSEPDGYPVHRGTMVPLSGVSALTWAAGNATGVSSRGKSFFQGGKSIPSPLLLTRHAGSGPLETMAIEALALTKMDWNNDALYDPVPVTIGYSKRLARTIANVPDLPRREYPYRMFM